MPASPTLVLFGATGDLCGRHLLPALARLFLAGELPDGFRCIGTGPQVWETATFHDHVRTRLAAFAADLDTAGTEAFLGRLSYTAADVLDPTAVGELVGRAAHDAALTLYLALPTHLIAGAVDGMERAGLPASARVAVEKPFGVDLASARELNAALARVTSDESHIFRVDHFLGMPVVQALPTTVARLLQEHGSSVADVARVSILWEETLALEGRAAFYDQAGALKDLLQNHLVQVLCQVLLAGYGPVPGGWSGQRLRALDSVRIPSADQARTMTRRGRYTAGTLPSAVDGAAVEVPDYVDEHGVDASRRTETFAEVTVYVDTVDRPTVEVVLRAGKAMGRARRGIAFEFARRSPGSTGDEAWIDLDQPPVDAPPAAHPAIESAPLEQLAYVNVLRDLLSGSIALSVSRAETEGAWEIFTPVLQEWVAGTVPLENYPAGTTPATADPPQR